MNNQHRVNIVNPHSAVASVFDARNLCTELTLCTGETLLNSQLGNISSLLSSVRTPHLLIDFPIWGFGCQTSPNVVDCFVCRNPKNLKCFVLFLPNFTPSSAQGTMPGAQQGGRSWRRGEGVESMLFNYAQQLHLDCPMNAGSFSTPNLTLPFAALSRMQHGDGLEKFQWKRKEKWEVSKKSWFLLLHLSSLVNWGLKSKHLMQYHLHQKGTTKATQYGQATVIIDFSSLLISLFIILIHSFCHQGVIRMARRGKRKWADLERNICTNQIVELQPRIWSLQHNLHFR